jgi:signal transduction histidine kinase
LEVVVADDGPDGHAPAASSAGGGQGLVGMQERAAVLGGSLSAGHREGRGFVVRAVLPVRLGR